MAVGGSDLAASLRHFCGCRPEQAAGQRAADAFVKQQKQQRYRDALGSQAIAVTVAETFEQPVSFQLAQVLAQLPQRAGLLGEAVGLQDRFLHLAAAPPMMKVQ